MLLFTAAALQLSVDSALSLFLQNAHTRQTLLLSRSYDHLQRRQFLRCFPASDPLPHRPMKMSFFFVFGGHLNCLQSTLTSQQELGL